VVIESCPSNARAIGDGDHVGTTDANL